MSFHFDKLTTKAREAVSSAQMTASAKGHVEMTSLHLLAGLLNEQSGVVKPLLESVGSPVDQLQSIVDSELKRLPTSSNPNAPGASRELQTVLEKSSEIMASMGDEFVSTEHLLLACVQTESKAQRILKLNAVDEKSLLEGIAKVRGNAKVTDQDPEGKYQVLDKFTIDLVAMAQQGKLDPCLLYTSPSPRD